MKWHQVFKRTVKFGFVTEDMSDIVQRYKASTLAPKAHYTICINLYRITACAKVELVEFVVPGQEVSYCQSLISVGHGLKSS